MLTASYSAPECDLCRDLEADLARMMRDYEQVRDTMRSREVAATRHEWDVLRRELTLAEMDVQLIAEERERHRLTHQSAN